MLSGVGVQCSKGWQPLALPPPGANAQVSCGLLSDDACCKPTRRICLSPESARRTLSPKHLASQALELEVPSNMVPVSYISLMQHGSTQQSTAQYSTAQRGHSAVCPSTYRTHKLVSRSDRAVLTTITLFCAQLCLAITEPGIGQDHAV